ncbi:MAG: hypothetical protein JWQ11_2722 [Rhizobacter sp.]|nr:hypothetical protein [Rhizobacter sp.]
MEPLTLYFDRNVGRRLPEALKLLQLDGVATVIHHHTERRHLQMSHKTRTQQLFAPDETDDRWLKYVGERGWVVVSQDYKFHKAGYEAELSAIKQFKVRCFYLWGSCEPTHAKALCFLRAFPKMLHAARASSDPFIVRVGKLGRLSSVVIR